MSRPALRQNQPGIPKTDQKPRSNKAGMINESQLPPSIRQSLPKGARANDMSDVLSEQNKKSMMRANQL